MYHNLKFLEFDFNINVGIAIFKFSRQIVNELDIRVKERI